MCRKLFSFPIWLWIYKSGFGFLRRFGLILICFKSIAPIYEIFFLSESVSQSPVGSIWMIWKVCFCNETPEWMLVEFLFLLPAEGFTRPRRENHREDSWSIKKFLHSDLLTLESLPLNGSLSTPENGRPDEFISLGTKNFDWLTLKKSSRVITALIFLKRICKRKTFMKSSSSFFSRREIFVRLSMVPP